MLHYKKFATRHLLYAQICRLALSFAATRFNCVVSHQQVKKKRRKRKFAVERPHTQDWCTNSHSIFITQILGAVCETHQSRLSVVQPFQDQQHKLVSSLITLSTKIGSSTAFLFLSLSFSLSVGPMTESLYNVTTPRRTLSTRENFILGKVVN